MTGEKLIRELEESDLDEYVIVRKDFGFSVRVMGPEKVITYALSEHQLPIVGAVEHTVQRLEERIQFREAVHESELVDHIRECSVEWLKDNLEEYDYDEIVTCIKWCSVEEDISSKKKIALEDELHLRSINE